MFKIFSSVFFLLSVYFKVTNSAQILAIFPFPGKLQYNLAQRYLITLAKRGHNMTVISHYPQLEKIKNFHDIAINYRDYEDQVLMSLSGQIDSMYWYLQYIHNVTLFTLENRKVQALLKSKTAKFDVVITDVMLTETLYAFGPHFGAHLIGVSSYGTDPNIDRLVGNISPLSYIPLPTSQYTDRLYFWERFMNLKEASLEWYNLNFLHFKDQRNMYDKYFPDLPYDLEEICRNFSLILLNQHFSISFPRPYLPNIIEVAGMFVDYQPTPLPRYVEDFINGAEHGVIYVVVAANMNRKQADKENLEIFLNVFRGFKERILWKHSELEVPNKPPNVMIRKTFSTGDILAHPKVKLFVSYGSLMNTIEAIHHAKPVVALPMYHDHFLNLFRAKALGYVTSVDYKHLNEENFKKAITDILENSNYTEKAKELSKRFHDQPMKPLDRAIYWTEYVIRHDGAGFMRNPGRFLNFWQLNSVDSITFVVTIWGLLIYMIFRIIKRIVLEYIKICDTKYRIRLD